MSHCITLSPYTIDICLCIRKLIPLSPPSNFYLLTHHSFEPLWPGLSQGWHLQDTESRSHRALAVTFRACGAAAPIVFSTHCCLPLRSDCSQTSFCDGHYGHHPIRERKAVRTSPMEAKTGPKLPASWFS